MHWEGYIYSIVKPQEMEKNTLFIDAYYMYICGYIFLCGFTVNLRLYLFAQYCMLLMDISGFISDLVSLCPPVTVYLS